MSPLQTVNALVRTATWRDGAGVRGVAGSNAFQTFDGERAREDAHHRAVPQIRRREPASQNGTLDTAPHWNGPLLRPTFVAQVLGQVMMDGPAANSAARAYRVRTAQVAHLVDLFDSNV